MTPTDTTLVIVYTTAIVLGIPLLFLLSPPGRKWIKKCKRRRGGIYLWRVDHHRNRARRVNGYVGETVSFHLRSRQHMGISRFDPTTGKVSKTGPVKVPAQPWSDLNPVRKDIIKLPWWLCWKWVLRPLETLAMVCTWPVYNDAKNRWNPRRITKATAAAQRRERDAGTVSSHLFIKASHFLRRSLQAAGVALVVIGAYGWMVTR